MGKRVVFLDRDGVINHDSPNYIKSVEEFRPLPGSLDAIGLLTRKGFDIILITNQSVIGRNMVTPGGLERIHAHLSDLVTAHGGRITDIFFCPHTPADDCECRKPKPGLIRQAQAAHGIDLSAAAMVGDSAKDIECARHAGCGIAILVQTGNGNTAAAELAEKNVAVDYLAADLLDAARWLVSRNCPAARPSGRNDLP